MDFTQLMWIVIVILLVMAILQIFYLFWLGITTREPKPVQQPSGPIMPTTPAGMNTIPPNYQNPTPRIGSSRMIVLGGLPGQKEIPIPGNNFGIGRFYSPESNILVAMDEKSVSRRHAIFMGDEALGEFYLTDTNSSYGTAVRKDNNFEVLTPGQRERIYNEDVVQFGNNVTVRFVLPSATRAAVTRM
ncbi:MAG: FHA domain-containing protein [Anaerolineae bacterium]|nr:FHA domain-containing protein [Anaerolineae bacterium]MBN8621288.1 FHA domain-containing protein [Anaerolineae bacterium]